MARRTRKLATRPPARRTPPARRASGGTGERNGHRPLAAGELVELVESLSEEFDEAGLHVAAREEFAGVRLSALRPMGTDRLAPGAVGWVREVRALSPRGLVRGEEVQSLLGWVYFIVHPTEPSDTKGAGPPSPIRDVAWGEFCYSEESRWTPRCLIAAKAESEYAAPLLRRFSEQLGAELESDSEA